jgi:hypothetical protein
LIWSKEELGEEKVKPKRLMADFCGISSENDYQLLKEHTEQARK